MTLSLLLACGVALAATAIDCAVVGNPCNGTEDNDQITGADPSATITGKDTIDALGDDSLSNNIAGPDGSDRLNGGAGNDRLLGGGNDEPYNGSNDYNYNASIDFYYLTTNWGRDTITYSGGAHDRVMPVDNATAAAMPPLTVNLVSDPDRPEVKDGSGNTVNWDGNVVDDAVTGGKNDKITQNSSDNHLYGGEGSDTYRGFTPGLVNGDYISDAGGTADVLDLSSFSVENTRLSSFTTGSGSTMVRYLTISLTPPPDVCFGGDSCQYIDVSKYFDNTGTDKCAANPGPGIIETIKFAGDVSVDFEQAKRLVGCR